MNWFIRMFHRRQREYQAAQIVTFSPVCATYHPPPKPLADCAECASLSAAINYGDRHNAPVSVSMLRQGLVNHMRIIHGVTK